MPTMPPSCHLDTDASMIKHFQSVGRYVVTINSQELAGDTAAQSSACVSCSAWHISNGLGLLGRPERQFKHVLSLLSLKRFHWHLPPVPPPLHFTASAAADAGVEHGVRQIGRVHRLSGG